MLDILERDMIAEAFRSTVDSVVSEHYSALTQEHQLVSRIAQRLEELHGMQIGRARLRHSSKRGAFGR